MQTTQERADRATGALPRQPASRWQPGNLLAGWFARLGRIAQGIALHTHGVSLLVWRTAVYLFTGGISLRELTRQMYWMGVSSVPIVLITGMLAGVVTSQQGGYQFTGGIPLYVLGSIVTSSVVLELGPIMTAVVLIGRVGARITAELGTMQVSEQIDALHSLGRDPVRTLVAPRIVAGIVVVPCLVAMANAAGIFSGMIAAEATIGLSRDSFLYGAQLWWHSWDMFYSLMKGVVFGFMIPLVASHVGLNTRGGAEGVGRATTTAVVAMTLSVLVLDAMFPPLLLN